MDKLRHQLPELDKAIRELNNSRKLKMNTTEAYINREEAWALIEKQMEQKTIASSNESYPYWHYGRCQLKELMDAIYGEYEK